MAIGSNLGDRLLFCRRALRALRETPGIILNRWSAVYLSPPAGFSSPHWFLNLVAEIKTSLSPWALLFRLWEIEFSNGRQRGPQMTDRTLDLDLILYNGLVLKTNTLSLPHPSLYERDFVLGPLSELVFGKKDPLQGKSFGEIFESLSQSQLFFFTFVEPCSD